MTDFSKFHLSESAKIVSDHIPGKESKKMIALQQKIEGSVVSYPRGIPIAIKKAKGAIIEDVDGNQFLDFFAGAGVVNLGHSNEEVLERVFEQQKSLIHALDFPTQNKMDAITKMLNALPDRLKGEYKVSFGGPTGSDAVEAAIKLAKIKTGRDTILAFSGGYHGMSAAALAMTSDVHYRKKLGTSVAGIHFIPYSYPYRCPFTEGPNNEESSGEACYKYIKMTIENSHSGIPLPAAIIIEPIQGEGGNIPAQRNFLEKTVKMAREHGIVVIFDEIQCGFYRSGKFLSFMHTDAVPDIITVSKGLGGVGLPIAGLIYRKDVEAWGPGDHIGTFRGNQASLAATNGAFDFVEKYKVADHATEMGNYLMSLLSELQEASTYIGEVRGKGLMIGVEMVKDKATKEPYPEFVKMMKQTCLQKGLLFEVGGHYSNVIRFVPPLIITRTIVENAVEILRSALSELDKGFNEKIEKEQSVEFAE
ncbi:MAG: aspartate aminotransferase family protein [Saprospiraceae bacterium]